MPNSITSTGLTTKTQSELITEVTTAMRAIYGNDINLDADTPDGQAMMIFIQATLDSLDVLKQIYNTFDPDSAIGVILDKRCAINGVIRQAGTYTLTNITLVNSAPVTLVGLDIYGAVKSDTYTIQDNAGTLWVLVSNVSIPTAGSNVLSFRAKEAGKKLTIPNTITVQSTIVLGVDSVNNPTTYSSLGLDEETDAQLKIRRQKSVSIASQGYLQSLLSSLLNISGITYATVYENNTSETDANSTPRNTIWVVVGGIYDQALVADAIYKKRNAGSGMRGAISYNVAQGDGTFFAVRWDDVVDEPIFIQFTVSPLDGISAINTAGIKGYIVANLVTGVGGQVNVNSLSATIKAFDSNALVTLAGFSYTLGGTYLPKLSPTAKNKRFAASAPNIAITVGV